MHGRMQRAVVIAFRVRNVIVELLGNRRPDVVHDAQSGIAVLHFVDDDAQRAHVIDFGKLDILLAHLVPDAVDVFWPAVDLGVGHAGAQQFGPQPFAGFGDELLALGSLLVEMLRNLLVDRRMQKAKGEILEFPLQFPDAEPVGQRRIERQRFARHRDPQLIRLFGGKVTQGLCTRGQPQEDHADVLDHRQQHLAQYLDLRLHLLRILFAALDRIGDKTARDRPHAVQTRNPVDQLRDARPENPSRCGPGHVPASAGTAKSSAASRESTSSLRPATISAIPSA